MKTYIDCIPCFYRQIIDTARIAGADDKLIKKIIDKSGVFIKQNGLNFSPPEIIGEIYQIIKNKTGDNDPYNIIKDQSNKSAMAVYDFCKSKIELSSDRLLSAVEMAIAGNIIDFGIKGSIDIEKEILNILKEESKLIKNHRTDYFAYEEFNNKVTGSSRIIYLGDNAGEIVFDKMLIEEILRVNPAVNIVYMVREIPIINDVLMSDAKFCGLDTLTDIVSSGSRVPGTVYKKCPKSVKKLFKKSDFIISKGQGNFESFVYEQKDVFYLFMAKCSIVAKEVGCNVGNINLYYKKKGVKNEDSNTYK